MKKLILIGVISLLGPIAIIGCGSDVPTVGARDPITLVRPTKIPTKTPIPIPTFTPGPIRKIEPCPTPLPTPPIGSGSAVDCLPPDPGN